MGHLHPLSNPIIITPMIASYIVIRIYMDGGSSVDILYEHCFNKLPEHIRSRLRPPTTPLIGFSSERSYPEGVVDFALTNRSYTLSRTIMLQFHIVKSTSKYNIILGRTAIQNLNMEVSTIRLVVEFPTRAGITIVRSDYPGRDASLVAAIEESNIREIAWEPIPGDTLKGQKVIINHEYPYQPITGCADLSPQVKNQLVQLLENSLDAFILKSSNMTDVPSELEEHSMGLNQYATLIRQKRRSLSLERS
ncbi:hypothetical protein Tco_1216140 [Tanacetum coccineum]